MALLVAICDDEKGIGAALENALIGMLTDMNIPHEIDVYFTGEELCAKMEAGAHYDLIFLDIEFAKNAINGIEVGKLIREAYKNNMVSIVYMSWKMQYSMQLFDIRPLNFLIKPLDFTKVENVVKTYLDIAGLWSQLFTYKVGHNTHKVPIKDIMYLESDSRKIILYLANGKKKEIYGTLKKIYQDQLQKFDFLFIHAAYVVNYNYIAAKKINEVILMNDVVLPISQAKAKETREMFYTITEKRRV